MTKKNQRNFSFKEDVDWVAYQASFAEKYDDQVMHGSALQSKVLELGRQKLESCFEESKSFSKTVEVGAGTGEHFPFIRHRFDEFFFTDTNADALSVAQAKHSNSSSGKLLFEKVNPGPLPYKDNSFDRLIATHVLEHINEPHLIIKDWNRVVKPGGTLSILIPTDPGLMWRLGRCFGPRMRAHQRGEPYDYLMARDHVNPCHNLLALIKYYYKTLDERWWPLNIFPHLDFNLFYIVNCIKTRDF